LAASGGAGEFLASGVLLPLSERTVRMAGPTRFDNGGDVGSVSPPLSGETGDPKEGEATRLSLFLGIFRGATSNLSSTGETSVARPLAPFHSGFSAGALVLFKFRTRSPNVG
jgi:hypothetical protein